MSDTEFPTLGEIRRFVGEVNLQKGRAYLRDDVWKNLSVRGDVVSGLCHGSGSTPYRVTIESDGEVMIQASCTCQCGEGGKCKHVAALLLYRRLYPDAFLTADAPAVSLERRTKRELIELICRMIRRAPELECLLDSSLPGASDVFGTRDPEVYRRQARAAYAREGTSTEVARELADIICVGDDFRRQGDVAAAAAAYCGVADVVLDSFERMPSRAGDLLAVVGECARGLRDCLLTSPENRRDDRRELLRALWEFFRADEAHGGLGDGNDVEETLVNGTTDEERRWLTQWIRSDPAVDHGWSCDYCRRAKTDLLRRLERRGTSSAATKAHK